MSPSYIALNVLLLSGGYFATAQVLNLQSACDPIINFFPTAADIKPTAPITTTVYDNNGNATVVTCEGTDNCAAPEPVFVSSSQVDYMPELQTNINNGLLKVVLAPGTAVPRLFFTVSSLLLTAKSDVTACIPVATSDTTIPAVRRLMSSTEGSGEDIDTDSLSTAVRQLASVAVLTTVAQPKSTTTNVSQAGVWSFTVSMDGGVAVQGAKNGNAGVVELPNDDSAVGEHCIEINVTISGYSLTPTSGPYVNPTVSRKICWYKPAIGHIDAELKIDMCLTKKFTVNIRNIAPLANNLSQNGKQVLTADGTPAVFFKPVLQLFGRKSRNLDGSEVAAYSYDASSESINFINRYIIPSTNITSASMLSYILDENTFEEGYYNMSAKISMISDYGNLIADSIGKGVIAQSDVYGAAVLGKTEIMATELLVFQEIGVQYSPTVLSEVSSDKLNKAIKAGDTITFTWNFIGIRAIQDCYHGTTLIANCTSPLKVQAMDVSAANSTVTFTVQFTDICGNTKKAEFTYSQNGVTSNNLVAATSAKPRTTIAKSSAGAVGTANSYLANVVMAAVSASILTWVLH